MSDFVSYEVIARAEAQEILRPNNIPTCLGELTTEQWTAVSELVADAAARGLDMGFAICDTEPDNPATLMEVYNTGLNDGRRKG